MTIDSKTPQKCGNPECHNMVTKYNYAQKRMNLFCSKKCSCTVTSRNTREKVKLTNLEKYGVSTPLASESLRNKVKDTLLEKYGVDHIAKSKYFKDKVKETLNQKYNVDNVSQLKHVRDKAKKTMLERHGAEHTLNSESLREKVKNTVIEKYGVDNVFSSSIIKEKIKKTNMEKYNRVSNKQAHLSEESVALLNDINYLTEQNNTKPLIKIASELGCSPTHVSHKFAEFGIPVKHHYSSYKEQLLVDYLSSIYDGEILSRYKLDGVEYDVFIPEKKLAIEFNGLFWHSENKGRDKNYHLNKTKHAIKHDLKLIHVYEDDWNDKNAIIKSIIGSTLNASVKYYARKCKVSIIDRDIEKDFLNTNHIQGYTKSEMAYGLYFNNELLSVITFGKPRYNTKYEYELIRFSNKLNTTVIGGAAKLFKYFIKNNKVNNIISYSHRHLFDGNMYKILGFNHIGDSRPSYYYLDKDYKIRYNRVKFQKHKLPNLLDIFDTNLTEWENMKLNGWDRIWDCGNSVWEWKL